MIKKSNLHSWKDLLETMCKETFKQKGFANLKIHQYWLDIVGARIAALCLPDRIAYDGYDKKNGVLYLYIEKPAFSLEVQSLESHIVQKVNVYMGYSAIRRVKVSVCHNPKLFKKNMEVKKRDPAPKTMPHDVKDDELRSALESLYSTF